MKDRKTKNSIYRQERRESPDFWFTSADAEAEQNEPKPYDWQWLTDAKWIGAFVFFVILLTSCVANYVFEKKP